MFGSVSRYPVALDLSDAAELTAMQLAGAPGSPVLAGAARRTVTDGQSPAQAAAAFVHDVLRSREFRGRSVSLLPPHGQVRSMPLRVQPAKGEDLEAAIVREATDALDFPIEEAVIDYTSVASEGKSERGLRSVLLVAMRREDVMRWMDVVRQAGGRLDCIESAAGALTRAHSAAAEIGTNPVVLCYAGRSHTVLVVVKHDEILAHRDIGWSGAALLDKLTQNLGLEGGERDADFLLRQHGLAHAVGGSSTETADDDSSHAAGRLLTPMADELVHELHNITGYVRSRSTEVTFGGICLYGWAARVRALAAFVAQEMGIKANAFDPLDRMGVRHAGVLENLRHGAAPVPALGLAMRRLRWL